MNNDKIFFKAGKAGFVLNAMLLATLTGCVGSVDGPSAGVYVAPAVVVVAAPADYVYYPGYNVYFNSNLHEFAYMDGSVWVSRPSFPGVSVDVLLASPSVRMDFHDSPANHNAEIVRQYPRSWTPSGANRAQKTEVQKSAAQKSEVQKSEVQRTEAKKSEVQKTQVKKVSAKKAPAPKANEKVEKRDGQ
jgi:hypothetical protein